MLSEFERKAWENRSDADKHKPDMALKVVLDRIEKGEINPKHILVMIVEDNEGGDKIHYTQAGPMSQLAVEGALLRAIWISKESGL